MRHRAVFLVVLLLLVPMTGAATAMESTDTMESTDAMESNDTLESTDAMQSAECDFPIAVTDGTGTTVNISDEPESIVTLGPSAAQTVWEIGGKDKVVGTTMHAHYLEWADPPENVSSSGESFVSVERVVALEPDLVLAPDIVSNETVERLRDIGITVYKFDQPKSIDDIKDKTRLTGRLTGQCAGAEETVQWMDSKLETVQTATADSERPTVLYVFFGFSAGTGTYAHDVIETAGGTNVAARANITGWGQINPEVVVEENPEWIVVNDGATQIPKTEAYNQTAAVQRDQIVVLEEEHISQAAPRVVYAVDTVTKALHPEAYQQALANRSDTQANGTTTPTTTDESQTTAPSADETPTTTPGIGIGGVLVAFVLVTIGFHRRVRRQ